MISWLRGLPLAAMFVLSMLPSRCFAAFHDTVGWFNTFVPGGGALLMGENGKAGLQFALEVGTFAVGYGLSAKSPMTLDGVPESIPEPHEQTFSFSNKKVCVKTNSRGQCLSYKQVTVKQASSGKPTTDISQGLEADILQEIGIKSHMVNVFNSYRKSAGGLEDGQGIDQSDLNSLFMAPFDTGALTDMYVYLPLLVSLGFHVYGYLTEEHYSGPPLNSKSNIEYGLVYGAIYPLGSGAPEEMFYRGFLQNQFYKWTGSPYLAVPLSTVAYTFSHSSNSWFSAAASGLFLGTLAYVEKGQLKNNIAFHFWSDVIMGIHAILSLQRNEQTAPGPDTLSIMSYEWQF